MPSMTILNDSTIRFDPDHLAAHFSQQLDPDTLDDPRLYWVNLHHGEDRPNWFRGTGWITQPDLHFASLNFVETTYPAPDLTPSGPAGSVQYRPHTRRVRNQPNGFPYLLPPMAATNVHPFVD
jgi:hypothetical protein